MDGGEEEDGRVYVDGSGQREEGGKFQVIGLGGNGIDEAWCR